MKHVVIVKVTNGMGNQLFQYAFARSLSLRLGCRVILDASWFWLARREVLMQKPLNDQIQRMPCCLAHFNLALPLTGMPISHLARAMLPTRY